MNKAGLDRSRSHLFPLLLLVTVTIAVYARTLGHEFMTNWDDHLYVTDNEAVRGFTREHLLAAFTRFFVGNYAPLQIVSYMADYTVWGLRPSGFILGNILLHTANGVLYYLLVAHVTKRRVWALVASFIFLTHPVQVESVAWVSQRKTVLAMFFFLGSFLLYIMYRERGWAKGKLCYADSLITFLFALLSKSVAVVLPVVVLLYDLCLDKKRPNNSRLLDKLPYIVAAAVVAFVALISQQPEFLGGRVGSSWGREESLFLTMLPVIVRYLTMLFWPANLSVSYTIPLKTGVDAEVLWAMSVLAGVATLGCWLYYRKKEMFFWFAVFFVGLVPVCQIIPLVSLMNDRYLYFPMLGAAAFVPGALFLLADKLSAGSRSLIGGLFFLILLPLPVLAHERSHVWKDSLTVWMDNAQKNPSSKEAWLPVAQAYQIKGNLDAALVCYMKVLSMHPTNRVALNNLGVLFLERGDLPRSHDFLVTLVNTNPSYPMGHCNLGDYYVRTGELGKAEAAYGNAVRLDPGYVKALTALASVQTKLKKVAEARQTYGSIVFPHHSSHIRR